MAKRPPKDPAAPARAPRPRRMKAAASVPPPVDSASDAPELIASEAPAPDRILAGIPDDTAMTMASRAAAATIEAPSDAEIRARAYQRFLARGGGHGRDFDDWLEAEAELRKR
ncbi:MAG: DUF2934 domain-containing protein [Vicinamibacterales bacterium]